ncbi:MAG: PEPxxWA-CTERM sorting domain-containing protein [Polymorphobacter sp.]
MIHSGKVAALAAIAGATFGAERAAALTKVNFSIAATDSLSDVVLGGGPAQYQYGGATFKTASTLVPLGNAQIGSLSSIAGIGANDVYDSNVRDILTNSNVTLPNDVFLHLKFDVAGQNQFGFAAFNTAGTLTSVSYKPASQVPEPAAWAMLITGFGAVGAALRRRRREARLGLAA